MNINQIELNGTSNYSLNGNNLSEYGVLSSSLGNPNCDPNAEMIDALGSSSQMYVYCTQSNDFDIKVEIVGGRAPFAIERPNGALWQGIENRLAVSYSHECGEVELLIYDSNNNSPPASCKVTVGIPAVDDLGKINQNVLLCNRSFDPKLDLCSNLESNCVVYKINNESWQQITSIDQLPVDFDDSDILEIKLYNDNQIQLHHYVFNFTVREEGQACNDNNICTINDKYNSDCYCEGESDNQDLEIEIIEQEECKNSEVTLRPNITSDNGFRWTVNGEIAGFGQEFKTTSTGEIQVEFIEDSNYCNLKATIWIDDYINSNLVINADADIICDNGDNITLSIDDRYSSQPIEWKDEFGNSLGTDLSYDATKEGWYYVEVGEPDCLLRGQFELKSVGGWKWKIFPAQSVICPSSDPVELNIESEPYEDDYTSIVWRHKEIGSSNWNILPSNNGDTSIEVSEDGTYSMEITTIDGCIIYDEAEVIKKDNLESLDMILKESGYYLTKWDRPDNLPSIINNSNPTRAPEDCAIDQTNVTEDIALKTIGSSTQITTLQQWYIDHTRVYCKDCSDHTAGYISLYTCNGSFDLNEFLCLGNDSEHSVTKSLIVDAGDEMHIYTTFSKIPEPLCINEENKKPALVKEFIKDLVCAFKNGDEAMTLSYSNADQSFVSSDYKPGMLFNERESFGQIAITGFTNGGIITLPNIDNLSPIENPLLCTNYIELEIGHLMKDNISDQDIEVKYFQNSKTESNLVEIIFPYAGENSTACLSLIIDTDTYADFQELLRGKKENIGTSQNIYATSVDIPSCLVPELCDEIRELATWDRPIYLQREALANLLTTNRRSDAIEILDCIYKEEEDDYDELFIREIYENYDFDDRVFPAIARLYFKIEDKKGSLGDGIALRFTADNDVLYELNGPSTFQLKTQVSTSVVNEHISDITIRESGVQTSSNPITPSCFAIDSRDILVANDIGHFKPYFVKVNNNGLALPQSKEFKIPLKGFAPIPGILLVYIAEKNKKSINTKSLVNMGLVAATVLSGGEVLAARSAGGLATLRGMFALGDFAGTFTELLLAQDEICQSLAGDFCKEWRTIVGVATLAAAGGSIYTSVGSYQNMLDMKKAYNQNPNIEDDLVDAITKKYPNADENLVRQTIKQTIGSIEELGVSLKATYSNNPLIDPGVPEGKINTLLEKLSKSDCEPKENVAAMLLNPDVVKFFEDNSSIVNKYFDDLIKTADGAELIGRELGDLHAKMLPVYKALEDIDSPLRIYSDFLHQASRLPDGMLDDLIVDLQNGKYALEEVFLESPKDVYDIWFQLKLNPRFHYELAKEYPEGSRWYKWSNREFFIDVTQKGRNFENNLVDGFYDEAGNLIEAGIKDRQGKAYADLKALNADLDERFLLTQVHFCRPGKTAPCKNKGEYFIADQVWVKFDGTEVEDMIIVDAKLSESTNFTDGQRDAKNHIGEQLNYKQKERREFDYNMQSLPGNINQNDEITIIGFYKAFGDGDKAYSGLK